MQDSGTEVALALGVADAKDVDPMKVVSGEDVISELGVAMVVVIVRAL